ncbi:MAG: M23 family metallopeptidase [Thermodesulfobacteriota bacterium]
MAKKRKFKWGKWSGLIYAALAAALMLVLAFVGLGSLDWEDPWLQLSPEGSLVGAKTDFTLKAGDQTSGLKEIKVTIKQDGQEKVVLIRNFPPGGEARSQVELPLTLEPQALGLKEGKATLTVTARDRSWGNFFQGRSQSLTRDLDIDFTPLTLAFISVNHLLRPGGTGVILYRLNKAAKESGVQVEGRLYQGYPNPQGAPGEYAAFFPIPQEAKGTAQVVVVARPMVGEELRQTVTIQLKPRKWREDRLNLSEDFMRRMAGSFPVSNPTDPLQAFLEINRDLRKANHEKVQQVCRESRPKPLWSGAFQRFLGKPMARFGDRRTYMAQGKAVDHQVHQGEDLASLEHSPVPAANNGVVVLAEPLGIYGQTVIVDHGLGVFSMYSHLSRMAVKTGDEVKKGAVLGNTGTTGLAGGDHLHFSMIIQGAFVDPVEWWDPHWLKDQVEKQWAKAGVSQAASAQDGGAPEETAPGKGKAGKGKSKRKKGPKPQE